MNFQGVSPIKVALLFYLTTAHLTTCGHGLSLNPTVRHPATRQASQWVNHTDRSPTCPEDVTSCGELLRNGLTASVGSPRCNQPLCGVLHRGLTTRGRSLTCLEDVTSCCELLRNGLTLLAGSPWCNQPLCGVLHRGLTTRGRSPTCYSCGVSDALVVWGHRGAVALLLAHCGGHRVAVGSTVGASALHDRTSIDVRLFARFNFFNYLCGK